jgi:UDP-2,3-diacylglucosamine pyrophosphatase LpxH
MGTLSKKRVIIVSDIHLGHKRSNFNQFNDFLNWIKNAKNKNQKDNKLLVSIDREKRKIKSPEMIIFLGDLLELWEPKDDDFGYLGRHSKKLIEKIFDIPCEKIYVLGNHDKSLEEFRAQEYAFSKGNFEIFYRHFPEKAESDYLLVGKRRYFFIHGHQFDKDSRYFRKFAEMGPNILLSLQRINKQLFGGWGFGSLIIAFFLWYIHLFCELWKFQNVPIYIIFFLAPFWSTNLIWRFIRPCMRRKFKTRDKSIESIVKNGWYESLKDTIVAENLVFAHTHYPDIKKGEILKEKTGKNVKKQLLVNTGSCFKKEQIENTFVYIDEKEILLIKWEKDNPTIIKSYNIDKDEVKIMENK